MRTLITIPVYNEASTVEQVLRKVRRFADHVLVINDGSTDATPAKLDELREPLGFDVLDHEQNLGYGRAMQNAFRQAAVRGYDWVITMDCDEQHEPESIPAFIEAAAIDRHDIISGSRYLDLEDTVGTPPADRRAINGVITDELNARLGMHLTDAFCGFKAYRTDAVATLTLSETGYAFPMQFWVQAAAADLRVSEIPVRLIYNDPNRTFGGGLDDPDHRLTHYRTVMHNEICAHAGDLPATASSGLLIPCCGEG